MPRLVNEAPYHSRFLHFLGDHSKDSRSRRPLDERDASSIEKTVDESLKLLVAVAVLASHPDRIRCSGPIPIHPGLQVQDHRFPAIQFLSGRVSDDFQGSSA